MAAMKKAREEAEKVSKKAISRSDKEEYIP